MRLSEESPALAVGRGLPGVVASMLALATAEPGNSQLAADSPFAARRLLGLISRSLGTALAVSGTAGARFVPSHALGMTGRGS